MAQIGAARERTETVVPVDANRVRRDTYPLVAPPVSPAVALSWPLARRLPLGLKRPQEVLMSEASASSNSIAQNQAQVSGEVSLNPTIVPVICAALLYAVAWVMGCGNPASSKQRPAGEKKVATVREQLSPLIESGDGKIGSTDSGRRLTVEKMAQRARTSLQFSNEEYGIAFDAPKGYLLKEGDLPDMDRGLGYLGPVPMHFADQGGVRLATVEPPTGVHMGTNFVNEFFTVSALYGSNAESCAAFDIGQEFRGESVTRTVDGIPFRGVEESAVASMHQYTGIYLHGYANETCYEIGYGVARISEGAARNIKRIDPRRQLAGLEKILDSVRIAPPNFERFTATD